MVAHFNLSNLKEGVSKAPTPAVVIYSLEKGYFNKNEFVDANSLFPLISKTIN